MEEFRASSSFVSHTRDMRWQSMDSKPFHTLLIVLRVSPRNRVQSRRAQCWSVRLCATREYIVVILSGSARL